MRVILNAVKNLLRIQTNIINMGILLHRPIVISTEVERSPTDSDYFYKHGISIVMHQVVIPTGTKWSGGIPYYAEGAFIQKHSIY